MLHANQEKARAAKTTSVSAALSRCFQLTVRPASVDFRFVHHARAAGHCPRHKTGWPRALLLLRALLRALLGSLLGSFLLGHSTSSVKQVGAANHWALHLAMQVRRHVLQKPAATQTAERLLPALLLVEDV